MRVVIFAFVCALVAGPAALAQAPVERPFDPARWPKQVFAISDGQIGFDPARKAMVRDLVDSRRLIGLSAEEAVAMLGPGDEVQDTVTYVLGPEAIGDFNPTTLKLTVENDLVARATTDETRFSQALQDQPFDPARWPKAEPVSHRPRAPGSDHWLTLVDPTRLSMAHDLIASRRLVGLERAQVLAMLGEATTNEVNGAILLAFDLAPGLDLMVRFEQGRASQAAVLRR